MILQSDSRDTLEIRTSSVARLSVFSVFNNINPNFSDTSNLEISKEGDKTLIPYSQFSSSIEVISVDITNIDEFNSNEVECTIFRNSLRTPSSPKVVLLPRESLKYANKVWLHYLADGTIEGSGGTLIVGGTGLSYNIDGGAADTIYTTEQVINGQP